MEPNYMTVGELIKKLKKVDPKRIVVMSRDPEGNGFSPMCDFWEGTYKDGDVGIEKLTKAYEKLGYSDDDVVKGTPAVILSPLY